MTTHEDVRSRVQEIMSRFDEARPVMRSLQTWERRFLLRCWDRLHKTPMRRYELDRFVNGLLWCFPEVRYLPRGTEFESPRGRTWSISKTYEPEFTVDKLIEEIISESLIEHSIMVIEWVATIGKS